SDWVKMVRKLREGRTNQPVAILLQYRSGSPDTLASARGIGGSSDPEVSIIGVDGEVADLSV
ncbi:MAG: hypothetical protein Q9174_006644, partial [Haloplaca sp. 1 TL-2023]